MLDDKTLDEVFQAIVKGRIEDTRARLKATTQRLTKKADQEVNPCQPKSGSVEPDDFNDGLGYPPIG